jgi:hypothetical protein
MPLSTGARMVALCEPRLSADNDFAKGRKFGLGEALSLLQQQALSFGIDGRLSAFRQRTGVAIALKE